VRVAGLARLEHLYSVANAEDSPVEVDAVRVEDVTQCYLALRQLDSRAPTDGKFIVLDLSTNYAVQAVLKQVDNRCSLTVVCTRAYHVLRCINSIFLDIFVPLLTCTFRLY